ncbi:hypothetical protein [Thermoanaerobacterium sp. DL9XJH110]|uniref:hypothetical protein n=1 Tax=Thermoanaerobacterium sp. DL9XJH110 TaxID=3386643 RepID=UPI003BB572CF
MRKRAAKDGDKVPVLKVTASDWEGGFRGMPSRVIAVLDKMSLHNLMNDRIWNRTSFSVGGRGQITPSFLVL